MFHWPMCQFLKGSRHAIKSCLSKKSAKSDSSVERICRLNDIVHICVNAAGILSHAANNCLAKTSEAVSSVTLLDHLWGARASLLAAMQLQIEEESWIRALHLISSYLECAVHIEYLSKSLLRKHLWQTCCQGSSRHPI